MLGVLSATIIALCLVSSYLAHSWVQREMNRQMSSVQETLAGSRFPLTDRVLEQVAGLSRAEYVLVDSAGDLLAASFSDSSGMGTVNWRALAASDRLGARRIAWRGGDYYHRAFEIKRLAGRDQGATLHVFVPAAAYDAAWRRAVLPPLFVGGMALLVTSLISGYVARRVTAPLASLQRHVARVARGEFARFEPPARRDEVRELAEAINRMAEKLEQYEVEVRRRERLQTLGRLGSSMAHQIRNAATGARMAIDLHRQELEAGRFETEGIELATEQLRRIERFLERLLQVGQRMASEGDRSSGLHAAGVLDWDRSDAPLPAVVESAMRHVMPIARHLDVSISKSLLERSHEVRVPGEPVEQALINLLRNAIEAAAEEAIRCHAGAEGERCRCARPARVGVTCRIEGGRVWIDVRDSGAGPSAELACALFEPFVSDKPGGAGLGLAVADAMMCAIGGEVAWCRDDGETCFTMSVPFDVEVKKGSGA